MPVALGEASADHGARTTRGGSTSPPAHLCRHLILVKCWPGRFNGVRLTKPSGYARIVRIINPTTQGICIPWVLTRSLDDRRCQGPPATWSLDFCLDRFPSVPKMTHVQLALVGAV